jgi:hypothetical protein
MERQLASVQKVLNIRPIPNADNIEVAEVLGWECIVLKAENVQVGDLVVYIEIDSIVPDRAEFEFLRDRKFRVRTIKLRKQISQGLVLPIGTLPKGKYSEGQDVTEILGIRKYDPQADKERDMWEDKIRASKNPIHKFLLRYPWYRQFVMKPKKGKFPSFIKKTDEDRIQLFPRLPETQKDTIFTATEKLDGQSVTYFLQRNKGKLKWFEFYKKPSDFIFGVCSRNVYLEKADTSSYWTIANNYKIEDVLHNLLGNQDLIVLQGEIIGEGIQGNKYKVTGYDFYAFNLIFGTELQGSVEAKDILAYQGVKFVPILDTNFTLKPTIQENVDYALGKSVLLPVLREGVVIRNEAKGLSYKIINPEFLLKNDE